MKKTQTPPITIILYFVGAILIIIGLCLTIRFAIANGERENLKSVYTEVSATVDYVDSVREGRHYKKYVKGHYTVNDKDYNVTFDDYPATVQEGDTIPVYYDPNDPGTIIKSPGRGTSFAANMIALGIIVAGFAAIIFGSRMKINQTDIDIESRYRSYEEYGGYTTERAGTLFDREINPAELSLDKPVSTPKGHLARRAERRNALFKRNEPDYSKKYAALLNSRPSEKPTAEDYIHEYTQGGNPAAARQYEQQYGSTFEFYKSPDEPTDDNNF